MATSENTVFYNGFETFSQHKVLAKTKISKTLETSLVFRFSAVAVLPPAPLDVFPSLFHSLLLAFISLQNSSKTAISLETFVNLIPPARTGASRPPTSQKYCVSTVKMAPRAPKLERGDHFQCKDSAFLKPGVLRHLSGQGGSNLRMSRAEWPFVKKSQER